MMEDSVGDANQVVYGVTTVNIDIVYYVVQIETYIERTVLTTLMVCHRGV